MKLLRVEEKNRKLCETVIGNLSLLLLGFVQTASPNLFLAYPNGIQTDFREMHEMPETCMKSLHKHGLLYIMSYHENNTEFHKYEIMTTGPIRQ